MNPIRNLVEKNIWENVSVKGHVEDVLKKVEELRMEQTKLRNITLNSC